MIGCNCKVCTSDNPRNQRFRCAGLIKLPNGNILIDTPPELRLQLLRANVGAIHSVLFTHYHADHLHGLDDLRPIQHLLGQPFPSTAPRMLKTEFDLLFLMRLKPLSLEKAKLMYPSFPSNALILRPSMCLEN